MSTATKTPAAPSEDTRATATKPMWRQVLATRAAGILLLDIVLFAFFTVQSDGGVFASTANIQSMLLTGTQALLLAVALSMMLGAGIFDLSLGANLVLSSVVGAKVMVAVSNPTPEFTFSNVPAAVTLGLLACLGTGLVYGAVNGFLVAYLRINALIATLGTLGIGSGIALVITDGTDIAGLPPAIQENFGLKQIGVVPLPAIVALLIAAVLYLVVRYTRFGMRTIAIGSSFSAAERVGIKAPMHLFKLALLGGAMAGFAGFIDLSRFASTALQGHANDSLNAVAAAVIGGTLLEGGKISIIGAVWGTALAVMLQAGLVIIGVSSYYQLIAVGLVLILAVAIDRVAYMRRQRS
jgi:ribose transport system permease protein